MKELLKLLAITLVISGTHAEEAKDTEHKDATAPEAKEKMEVKADAKHEAKEHHVNRAQANKYTKALAAMQNPWTGPMATINLPTCCNHKPTHKAHAAHHHKAAHKKADAMHEAKEKAAETVGHAVETVNTEKTAAQH